MDSKKLQALYGLKWNPFSGDVPTEALAKSAKVEHFLERVVDLVGHGGFGSVGGDPGTGKSVVLRQLADRLSTLREVVVADITRPQSGMSDFYRELGNVFGIVMSSSNRWGGYKMLREKWQAHIKSTLLRPVLLIDEAQEVHPMVLEELRLLGSTRFDSCTIVTVVLAGDRRLQEKLRTEALLPLDSRIKARLVLEPVSRDELCEVLRHAMEAAGNPNLMTDELICTLAEHAVGNLRCLMQMADDVLVAGAARGARRLDEGLFLELSSRPPEPPPKVRPRPSAPPVREARR